MENKVNLTEELRNIIWKTLEVCSDKINKELSAGTVLADMTFPPDNYEIKIMVTYENFPRAVDIIINELIKRLKDCGYKIVSVSDDSIIVEKNKETYVIKVENNLTVHLYSTLEEILNKINYILKILNKRRRKK